MHSHQMISACHTAPKAVPASAFERLSDTAKGLDVAVARLADRLTPVLTPVAAVGPAGVCSPEPLRCPLKQTIHEIDELVCALNRMIDAIEL